MSCKGNVIYAGLNPASAHNWDGMTEGGGGRKSLDVVDPLELFSVKFPMNKMDFKGSFAVFQPDFFKLQ